MSGNRSRHGAGAMNPESQAAFYRDRQEALRKAHRTLVENMPAMADVVVRLRHEVAYEAPLVGFCCPSCAQRLVTVHALVDAEGWLLLQAHGGKSTLRSTDPVFEMGGLGGSITSTVEIRCRNGCPYRGRQRHERLLLLYGAAIQLGNAEATLPS